MYRRFYALDHSFREVNQLLKYIKFGFGFTTDQACYDIRDGVISREEAIFLVKELDGGCGKAQIASFCKLIDITEEEFWEVANSFRGTMWLREKGKFILDSPIWDQEPLTRTYSVREIMKRVAI